MSELDDLIEVEIDSTKFLLIAETLTRIGIASRDNKKLYQTCHILHKRGKYYIVHFKELFKLDGKSNTFDEDDRRRRNTIINLLEDWGLLKIKNELLTDEELSLKTIKFVPFKEKSEWELIPKYSLGKKKE